MPRMYPYLPLILNQTYPIESFWTPHGVDISSQTYLRCLFLGFWLQFGIIPVEMDETAFENNNLIPPTPAIEMWLNSKCNHPSHSSIQTAQSYNLAYPLNTITLNVINKPLFIRALSYLTPEGQTNPPSHIPLWEFFNTTRPDNDTGVNPATTSDNTNDDDHNAKDGRGNRSVKNDCLNLFLRFDGVIFQLLTLNEYKYNSLNTYNLTCACVETFSPGLPADKDPINKFTHYHKWLQNCQNDPVVWEKARLDPQLFSIFQNCDIQTILTHPLVKTTATIVSPLPHAIFKPHFYPQHLPSRLSQFPGMTSWYRDCGLVRTQLPSYGASLHLFPVQLLGLIEYSKASRGYRLKQLEDPLDSSNPRQLRPSQSTLPQNSPSLIPNQSTTGDATRGMTLSTFQIPGFLSHPQRTLTDSELVNDALTRPSMIPINHPDATTTKDKDTSKQQQQQPSAQHLNKDYTREYNDIVFDTNAVTSIDAANNYANLITTTGNLYNEPDVKVSYGLLPPDASNLTIQPQLNAIYRLQRLQANNATIVPPSAKPYIEAMDKTLTTHINTQNTTIQHLVQQNQTVLESIGELATYTNVLSVQFQQMSNMMLVQQTEFMNGLQKLSNMIDKQESYLNDREDCQTIKLMSLFDELEQVQESQLCQSRQQLASHSNSALPPSPQASKAPKISNRTDFMIKSMKDVLFQRFLQRQQEQHEIEREIRKRSLLHNADGHHLSVEELDGANDGNVVDYSPIHFKRQRTQQKRAELYNRDLSAELINQYVQLSPQQELSCGYSAGQPFIAAPQVTKDHGQKRTPAEIEQLYKDFTYQPNGLKDKPIQPGTMFIEEDI